MNYIEYTISEFKRQAKEDKKENKITVLRAQTKSENNQPRLLRILEIGDDYIVARGRAKDQPEVFSISGISSWRFHDYVQSQWKW